VKVVRVELTSESISTRTSPSAADDFEFRLFRRPSAGYGLSYPIVPLCY